MDILLTPELANYLVGIVFSLVFPLIPKLNTWYHNLGSYKNGWLVKRAVFGLLVLAVSAGTYLFELRTGLAPSLNAYLDVFLQVFGATVGTHVFVGEKIAKLSKRNG